MTTFAKVVTSELRVRYVETDAQGVVHHSAYVPWLEMGRIEFCRAIGIDYRGLETKGFFLAVVSLSIDYHAPAYFDDLLLVKTQLAHVKRSSMQFHYEIVRKGGPKPLTSAQVVLVCLNCEKRPVAIPNDLRELFCKSLGQLPEKRRGT